MQAALHRMEFPAEDESTGAICELCWHGPGRGSGSLAMQDHVTSCKMYYCILRTLIQHLVTWCNVPV